MITIYPLREFKLPITVDCLNPGIFQNGHCREIVDSKVWEGNKQKKLGELFRIEEAGLEDSTIAVCGDVSKVRRIGACMTSGTVIINGDVGMHLGEEMKGGKIIVNGNVGSWAGSMMKGGEIEIHGNVGDYLGAPYRGSDEGMAKGRIIVYGTVGNEAGAHMKSGMLKIYGNVGQFTGFRMHDGTIYVQKDCAGRVGACMEGGKIIIGGCLESVLPTFTIDSVKAKVKIEEGELVGEPFYVFLGDLAENGNGKLYVLKEKNPQLSHFERFL
jgi:formylmethanofuran dehydrogenase subunit C